MIVVHVFSRDELEQAQQNNIQTLVKKALGADQDLSEFYRIARKDGILKSIVIKS